MSLFMYNFDEVYRNNRYMQWLQENYKYQVNWDYSMNFIDKCMITKLFGVSKA